MDAYSFFASNHYSGLRFEDFLCKTMPVVKVLKFKNIKNRGKVYKTVFTMKSHPTRNEDGNIALMEIEWVKPVKVNELSLVDKELTLEEIKIMKDFIIKSVKIKRS